MWSGPCKWPLGQYPPPAIAVLANDLLPVPGYTRRTVISLATVLSGFVARPLVSERVARHSWGRRRHRRRWLRRRRGRRGHRACPRRCNGRRGSRCRRCGRRKRRRGSRDPNASAPDSEQGHERRRCDLRISHSSLAYNHAMMFRQDADLPIWIPPHLPDTLH
jgi:hypothetical protein